MGMNVVIGVSYSIKLTGDSNCAFEHIIVVILKQNWWLLIFVAFDVLQLHAWVEHLAPYLKLTLLVSQVCQNSNRIQRLRCFRYLL